MTSRTIELPIPLSRDGTRSFGRQIEDFVRHGMRSGALHGDAILPSTRDLARQLGISRPVVVDAYAQLASEGFIVLRQGARPRIAGQVAALPPSEPADPARAIALRYDLRPATPDLSQFPKRAWLKAMRHALDTMATADFGYGDQLGTIALREALADYLGRVRSVVASPRQVVITNGFAQARSLFCRAIAARGGRLLAVEDPAYSSYDFATLAGLQVVPVPVDEEGIDVTALAQTGADAVSLTPTHQSPTGVALSGRRRRALIEWLDASGAVALEDDYDAEFRYDRAPVGAIQGLAPGRVVYAGTASKTLAPALRLGWMVVPDTLHDDMRAQFRAADLGPPRIDQHALAGMISSGDFDRHLRRMRLIYDERRAALLAALAELMPYARVQGIEAGIQVMATLPWSLPEDAVRAEAARRGVHFEFLSGCYLREVELPSALLLGYGQLQESGLRIAIRILAEVIAAIRGVVGRGATGPD